MVLQAVRATAAWRLHEEGADQETVVSELERWALLPRARARSPSSSFSIRRGGPTSPATSRVTSLPKVVDDDPSRFARLLNEQLVPDDLVGAQA